MSQRLSLATTPERSQLMAGVRQTGTANELLVQSLLRSLGHRFTVKARDLPGTPDIVNRSRRWLFLYTDVSGTRIVVIYGNYRKRTELFGERSSMQTRNGTR